MADHCSGPHSPLPSFPQGEWGTLREHRWPSFSTIKILPHAGLEPGLCPWKASCVPSLLSNCLCVHSGPLCPRPDPWDGGLSPSALLPSTAFPEEDAAHTEGQCGLASDTRETPGASRIHRKDASSLFTHFPTTITSAQMGALSFPQLSTVLSAGTPAPSLLSGWHSLGAATQSLAPPSEAPDTLSPPPSEAGLCKVCSCLRPAHRDLLTPQKCADITELRVSLRARIRRQFYPLVTFASLTSGDHIS